MKKLTSGTERSVTLQNMKDEIQVAGIILSLSVHFMLFPEWASILFWGCARFKQKGIFLQSSSEPVSALIHARKSSLFCKPGVEKPFEFWRLLSDLSICVVYILQQPITKREIAWHFSGIVKLIIQRFLFFSYGKWWVILPIFFIHNL